MHVLHLEDDNPLCEILRVAFEAADPTIDMHQFGNSDEALKYIQETEKPINLYILDIRVPGSMNGLELAHKIRELEKPGAIVLTSAFEPPDRDKLNELKSDWFPKPWHIMETTKKLFEIAQTQS